MIVRRYVATFLPVMQRMGYERVLISQQYVIYCLAYLDIVTGYKLTIKVLLLYGNTHERK